MLKGKILSCRLFLDTGKCCIMKSNESGRRQYGNLFGQQRNYQSL